MATRPTTPRGGQREFDPGHPCPDGQGRDHRQHHQGQAEHGCHAETAAHVCQLWVGSVVDAHRDRFERHATDRALARPILPDLGVHGAGPFAIAWAGVGLWWRGALPAVLLVGSRLPGVGVLVCCWRGGLSVRLEEHAALGAAARVVTGDLGVHGAGEGVPFSRDGLVGWGRAGHGLLRPLSGGALWCWWARGARFLAQW